MKLVPGIKLALALGLSAVSACANAAGTYPDHPIHFILPFSAGGGVDIIGRITAKALGDQLHINVVPDNKPGAGSNLGAAYVAHSPADGYTLLLASGALAVNKTLFKDPGFNSVTDFVRIGRVAEAPALLVVAGTSQFHSLKELIDYGRAHPKGVSFASTGYGSNQHMNGEIVASHGGLDAVHVPYKGGPPAETDLVAGRTTFFMTVPAEVFGFIKAGQLRPLAVSGTQRMRQFPDVPTLRQAGVDDDGLGSWWGVAAPAGTPPAVVKKLSDALMAALKTESVNKQIIDVGDTPAPLDAKAFEAFFQAQVKEYAALIKKFHIAQQ